MSAYIPTNVISITDGQIYLETDLFFQGVRPAISVGLSVSRVGSAAQIKAIKQVAGKIKLDLAQFRELAAFAQFGSDLDAATKARLDRGQRIVELFKQIQYNPIPVEEQVAVLWAMQNGYLDPVPVEQVKEFQMKLQDYLQTRKESLLAAIRTKKAIDKDLEAELATALNDFKATWQVARLTEWRIRKTSGAGSNRSATRRRLRRRCRWSPRRRCARRSSTRSLGGHMPSLMNRVLVSLKGRTDPLLHPLLQIRPSTQGTGPRHQHRQRSRRRAQHELDARGGGFRYREDAFT